MLIVKLIEKIAEKHRLLFVLHPPTIKQLEKFHLLKRLQSHNNIECIPRLHHSDFLTLLQSAEFVVTDGGSLQEETSYLGKPCLLLRKTTERLDGVGENVILSEYKEDVIENFIHNYKKHQRLGKKIEISPSNKIVQSILSYVY